MRLAGLASPDLPKRQNGQMHWRLDTSPVLIRLMPRPATRRISWQMSEKDNVHIAAFLRGKFLSDLVQPVVS
jgi:hypothetical protein